MQLQRYYLWCIKEITANNNGYLIKFYGPTNSLKSFIFASPLVITNANLVSQHLSLTYLPRHRYGFDSKNFRLFDNEGNEITSQNPNDFLRVWPAFGKYGGGIEVLVELKSSVITPMSDNILLDGGAVDRFHQDAVLPMTKQILESIYNGTRDLFEGETGIGLVREGLPVFQWQRSQDNFTISVGIKETPDGMILHIWGTKWRDFPPFRCICCILESEFQALLIGREELEKSFNDKQNNYFTEFSHTVKEVIRKLKECEEPEYPFLRCCMYPEYIFRLP
jgi:hypothetical protein